LRRSDRHPADAGLLNDKRSQMLSLQPKGDLALVAANNAVPLAELVSYRQGEYSVAVAMIRQLIDSAATADPRCTPSNAKREARKFDTQAMYEDWRKAYRDLKKQRRNMSGVWYSKQIAKQDIAAGRSAETIRKHMRK
jgi:hypothetical protein